MRSIAVLSLVMGAWWGLAQEPQKQVPYSCIIPVDQPDLKVHVYAPYAPPNNRVDFTCNVPGGSLNFYQQGDGTFKILEEIVRAYGMGGYELVSNRKFSVVVEYEGPDGDLNLAPIKLYETPIMGLLISHLGLKNAWNNRLTLTSLGDVDLEIAMPNEQSDGIFIQNRTIAMYTFDPFTLVRGQAWCAISNAMSGVAPIAVNGVFEFMRTDGIRGSAAVAPYPYADVGLIGSNVLFLTHVARDTGNFWTGYSILNPNEQDANVALTAIGLDGLPLAMEPFMIPAMQQSVAVIGVDRLASVPVQDISWIVVESSHRLVGLELFGSPSQANSYLAGFELASVNFASHKVVYAAMDESPDRWTGICVLNPNSAPANITYYFSTDARDDTTTGENESVISWGTKTLNPGEKWVFTLDEFLWPIGFGPDDVTGFYAEGDQDLLGFVLIGDNARTQLAGYPAQNY